MFTQMYAWLSVMVQGGGTSVSGTGASPLGHELRLSVKVQGGGTSVPGTGASPLDHVPTDGVLEAEPAYHVRVPRHRPVVLGAVSSCRGALWRNRVSGTGASAQNQPCRPRGALWRNQRTAYGCFATEPAERQLLNRVDQPIGKTVVGYASGHR